MFCREHGISRETFYVIRRRAVAEGEAAVWQPRSRRPRTSPGQTPQKVVNDALAARAALVKAGLDAGPISVMDRMQALGQHPPSRATLARIFTRAGVVDPQPRKRPRSSWRRFVHPYPNCMWQLDGFEYSLAGGRTATILQVIDDHSRMILASRAAPAETSVDVVAVVRTAIARHGVPQKFLSDNGTALNPSRRGRRGQLMSYLQPLGVEMKTGKPGKPTTQGKSERHHQTTARWLDSHELCPDLPALQLLLEEFEVIYNTQRRHQGLPGRITPHQAWLATEKAPAPTPPAATEPSPPPPHHPASGQVTLRAGRRGSVCLLGHEFMITQDYAHQDIHVIYDPKSLEFFNTAGDSIHTIPRPAPGAPTYIGNGRPRGFLANRPSTNP